MSDQADSNPQNSFQTIEQAIEQAYINFQAEFLPARSSSAQAQDFPSTPSSTQLLISSPRQRSNVFYNVPLVLTSDFEIPTQYPPVTMTNPANQLPPYDSDVIAQANSSYFFLPMGCIPAEIDHNQVVVRRRKEKKNVPSSSLGFKRRL